MSSQPAAQQICLAQHRQRRQTDAINCHFIAYGGQVDRGKLIKQMRCAGLMTRRARQSDSGGGKSLREERHDPMAKKVTLYVVTVVAFILDP